MHVFSYTPLFGDAASASPFLFPPFFIAMKSCIKSADSSVRDRGILFGMAVAKHNPIEACRPEERHHASELSNKKETPL
jgi:hypothetical protein